MQMERHSPPTDRGQQWWPLELQYLPQQPQRADTHTSIVAWDDELTLCILVNNRGVGSVGVARRCDNDMVNGTKLLNATGMTRGRRDGILKGERTRKVVKAGPIYLKGVWIPLNRAIRIARENNILDSFYPLFEANIEPFLYHPLNIKRTQQVVVAAERRIAQFGHWLEHIPRENDVAMEDLRGQDINSQETDGTKLGDGAPPNRQDLTMDHDLPRALQLLPEPSPPGRGHGYRAQFTPEDAVLTPRDQRRLTMPPTPRSVPKIKLEEFDLGYIPQPPEAAPWNQYPIPGAQPGPSQSGPSQQEWRQPVWHPLQPSAYIAPQQAHSWQTPSGYEPQGPRPQSPPETINIYSEWGNIKAAPKPYKQQPNSWTDQGKQWLDYMLPEE